jgi:hypothetical protein
MESCTVIISLVTPFSSLFFSSTPLSYSSYVASLPILFHLSPLLLTFFIIFLLLSSSPQSIIVLLHFTSLPPSLLSSLSSPSPPQQVKDETYANVKAMYSKLDTQIVPVITGFIGTRVLCVLYFVCVIYFMCVIWCFVLSGVVFCIVWCGVLCYVLCCVVWCVVCVVLCGVLCECVSTLSVGLWEQRYALATELWGSSTE